MLAVGLFYKSLISFKTHSQLTPRMQIDNNCSLTWFRIRLDSGECNWPKNNYTPKRARGAWLLSLPTLLMTLSIQKKLLFCSLTKLFSSPNNHQSSSMAPPSQDDPSPSPITSTPLTHDSATFDGFRMVIEVVNLCCCTYGDFQPSTMNEIVYRMKKSHVRAT